jgi:Bacterial archaeo-eukaryotic release factor family 11
VLYLDIPTLEQFRRLSETRADACVSIYLPTTTLSQEIDASRVELGNLLKAAVTLLSDAGFDKRRLASIRGHIEDLLDDDEFWRFQARSLAILVTPDQIQTFRLANALLGQVEVSNRFHLKPLLRAITFPHTAFVLALSENGARLVEIFADGPPVELPVADLPRDAASAAGRASINDRSPSGRIQGSEGKKVRLIQYARKVDAALRPVLAGQHMPLFLAAAEPLASIFHSVSSSADLVPSTITGNSDRVTDAELASAARLLLDQLYARRLADLRALYDTRAAERRTTTDLSDAARAAAYGAIEGLAVDIDAVVPGTFDEATGQITLAGAASKDNYGVVDAIAARALATGATVLGVRKADMPGGSNIAAVLRYAF